MSVNKWGRTILLALGLVGLAAQSSDATVFMTQYLLSQDASFQQQVTVAMEQWAVYILESQTSTSPSYQGHLTQAAFAVQILQNPTKWTPEAAVLIASQGANPMTPLTTPSTVADALVSTAAGVVLPSMAGYYAVPAQ